MSERWTLPLIQGELDALHPGHRFRLDRDDAAHLFGLNSAAVGRITKFANGHDCEVVFTARDVLFQKDGAKRPRVKTKDRQATV